MMVTKFNSYVAYFLSPLFITVSCWGNAGFWSHKKLDYSRNSALLSVMASYVQKKMSDPIVVMLSHLHSIFFLIIGGSSIVVLVLLVWRSLHSLHPWSSGQNCLYELKPQKAQWLFYIIGHIFWDTSTFNFKATLLPTSIFCHKDTLVPPLPIQ